MEIKCKVCLSVMNVKPSHVILRKCCSYKCLGIYRMQKRNSIPTKTCSICGVVKLKKFFWIKTGQKRQSYCNECGTKKNKMFYDRNKETFLKQKQNYYLRNKDSIIKKVTEWNKSHPKQRVKYMVLENAKRRTRKLNNGGTFSRKDWLELISYFNHTCIYCDTKGKMTLDHFIPISKGGIHDKSNIVPSCGICNNKKNNREPNKWVIKYFGQNKLDEIKLYLSTFEMIKKCL